MQAMTELPMTPSPLIHLRDLLYKNQPSKAWAYARRYCWGGRTEIAKAQVLEHFPKFKDLALALDAEPFDLEACIVAGQAYDDRVDTVQIVMAELDLRIPGEGAWWYSHRPGRIDGYSRFILSRFPRLTELRHLWWAPNWLCGSDYSGGVLVASNIDGFWGEHSNEEGVDMSYGGHNTMRILISVDTALHHEAIHTTLDNLSEYCVLDEGHYSEMQIELESEGWENWAESDFTRVIEKELDIELGDEPAETLDLSEDAPYVPRGLHDLFSKVCETENIDWDDTDSGLSVDTTRAGEAVTLELLDEFKVPYEKNYDEEEEEDDE